MYRDEVRVVDRESASIAQVDAERLFDSLVVEDLQRLRSSDAVLSVAQGGSSSFGLWGTGPNTAALRMESLAR
jgi:hypothetical protein